MIRPCDPREGRSRVRLHRTSRIRRAHPLAARRTTHTARRTGPYDTSGLGVFAVLFGSVGGLM